MVAVAARPGGVGRHGGFVEVADHLVEDLAAAMGLAAGDARQPGDERREDDADSVRIAGDSEVVDRDEYGDRYKAGELDGRPFQKCGRARGRGRCWRVRALVLDGAGPTDSPSPRDQWRLTAASVTWGHRSADMTSGGTAIARATGCDPRNAACVS